MTSTKSLQPLAVRSGLPEAIVSTSINPDTGRLVFCDPETGLPFPFSRSEKTCRACGATKAGRGPFCQACALKARTLTYVFQCAICGAEVDRLRYEYRKMQLRGVQEVYCGESCHREATRRRNMAGRTKFCICGNPIPRSRAKFCSDDCEKQHAQRRTLADRICGICGASFHPVSHLTQYCSRECANAAHALRMIGQGNSNYKDGTSYAQWFRDMRPLILERDRHRCVTCGQAETTSPQRWKGQTIDKTNLRIHHIDENVANNSDGNLITLCGTCHRRHHASEQTPWPWFAEYVQGASRSMTSKWRAAVTSLQKKYSSITA